MIQYKSICPEIRFSPDFQEPPYKIKVTNSSDFNRLVRPLWRDISLYESAMAIFLNKANNTIGYYRVSIGGIAGTVIDPAIVANRAVSCLASGAILVHNHPSGNMVASKADRDITTKVKQVLSLLDMQLIDHVILSGQDDRYYSFADEGLI